jgi:flavin-dependent dehydrogenase
VRGVATGDMGVTRSGERGANFQPGMELHARLTLLAEGCRGSLTKVAMERFRLRDGVRPQTYGLGFKELWEIDPARHVKGQVIHTVGWPMRSHTYGGSWLYMFGDNLISIGFVSVDFPFGQDALVGTAIATKRSSSVSTSSTALACAGRVARRKGVPARRGDRNQDAYDMQDRRATGAAARTA